MLRRLAYRMMGSVADAEDIVQDAWLRWSASDRSSVELPDAYLRRSVTNLCLDRIKATKRRREDYVGPWLPEPIVESDPVDDVTLPLLLALERLSPLERAAFLLHDVFGESFEAVGLSLGRSSAACRQLAARARDNVRASPKRFDVNRDKGLEIAEAFIRASRTGDAKMLASLLADDVRLHSDGGGNRPAVARVLDGTAMVRRALMALARLETDDRWHVERFGWINGLPGIVTREADGLLQTTALLIKDDLIKAIYIMRNPEKLRHLN